MLEATTLGAAFLAGLAIGTWSGLDDIAGLWKPARVVEPAVSDGARVRLRTRWTDAIERAKRQQPDLSALDF